MHVDLMGGRTVLAVGSEYAPTANDWTDDVARFWTWC
jgi:hypothetical protein